MDIFWTREKRKETALHYVFRAGVCTRTCVHTCRQTGRSMHTLGKHEGRTAAHRKNRLMNRSRREKQPRHGKVYPQLRTFFFKERKEKPEKVRSWPPKKSRIFLVCSQKRPVLYHPKDKISREPPFFANRRTRISRKRPVSCQPENEKNEPGDHFPSPSWEIPAKIPPPKDRKSEKNFRKTENGATCSQPEQGFFHAAGQMTSRKSHTAGTFLHRTARIFYVSLPGNVRSTWRKPMFPDRKTYGFHTGNIENIKEKRGYPADIFRIRNTGKTNGPFTGKEQKSRIRKNKVNSLRGNLQKTRKIKADWKQKTSRKDIKKGVPLNSNLC